MSKYIPAIRVIDHFKELKYEFDYGTKPFENYQDALNSSTELARRKSEERPVTRMDGFEFKNKNITPVVLKEVEMVEKDD